MENPYDIDRNFFIERARKFIPYLKKATQDNLKMLFYQSDLSFYRVDQQLFLAG